MQLPGVAFLLGSLGLFIVVRNDLVQVQWNSEAILLALYLGVITMGLANAMQILGSFQEMKRLLGMLLR